MNLDDLNSRIVYCRLCPRLVEWREQIAREKKPQFKDWDYGGKPVPNFGDPKADRLIVGLNGDASVRRLKGEGRPLQEVHARAEVLAALEAVDLVVVFDQDTPLELIRRVRPKVLAKGGDYRREEVVGHELVESDGGDVILVDLMPGFSTSKIVRRSRMPAPVRGS